MTKKSSIPYLYKTLPLTDLSREKMRWVEKYNRLAKLTGSCKYYWKSDNLARIKQRVANLRITLDNMNKYERS